MGESIMFVIFSSVTNVNRIKHYCVRVAVTIRTSTKLPSIDFSTIYDVTNAPEGYGR